MNKNKGNNGTASMVDTRLEKRLLREKNEFTREK
jgi:hypothetical protein